MPLGGSWKRIFDTLLAGLMLIGLSPVMLLTYLAVKLTDRGPALFWSERVGLGGKVFRMPKFRTMRSDTPLQPREQFSDARSYLTPIGGFLRRSSLDELPQLFCVVRGDMSLVGPRPLLPEDPCISARAGSDSLGHVRPGLTGLAQICGRNRVTSRNKARYDHLYASRWSPILDVQILAITVVCVLIGKDVL